MERELTRHATLPMNLTALPSQHHVKRALIPVGGRGTRMYPATAAVPKELLAIGNRPLLEFALDEIADAGIGEVVLVTARGKSAIEDLVEDWSDRHAGVVKFAYGVPLSQRRIDCGSPDGYLEAQLCHARAPDPNRPVALPRVAPPWRAAAPAVVALSPTGDCA